MTRSRSVTVSTLQNITMSAGMEKGYPEGLQGDEIPLWSQIVGIVDVYDALVSPRVYKKHFPMKSNGNDTCGRVRYIQSDSFRMSEGCGGTIEKMSINRLYCYGAKKSTRI